MPSTSVSLATRPEAAVTVRAVSSLVVAVSSSTATGVSLTGVSSRVALPATVRGSARPLVVPLSVMV